MKLLPSRNDRKLVKTGIKIQVIQIANIYYFELKMIIYLFIQQKLHI